MDQSSIQDMDHEKAETSMLPQKTFVENGNRLYQVVAAIIVCYICLCGGNLTGFTSSAIPSMRQPSFRMEKLCSSKLSIQNRPELNASLVKIPSQIEISAGSTNNIDQQCSTVWVADVNDLQNVTDAQASWIGGLAPLGAFFGSLGATISVKLLGPKGSLLYLGFPLFLLSWITTAMAPSIMIVYIGRFLGGIALGLAVSASPLYIIDTASITLRGPLGTLTQFLFTLGVLSSFILGSFLSWRQLAWTCAALVLPGVFMIFFVPESPVWLLSKNRKDEAEASFYKMHGSAADFKGFLEDNEFHTDVNQNTDEKRRGLYLFFNLNKAESRSCIVAVALCVFQQLCGINGINFYTLSIFKAASEGSTSFVLSNHVSSILVASVFCMATFPSYTLIEKCGRKLLLMCSILVMIFSSASLGTYFYIKEMVQDSYAFRLIPLACLILFVLAFSSGYGPILYIFVAEILSPDIRTVFSPIAVGINWLAVFFVTKSFPDLIVITGIHGVFWLYAALSTVGLIFVIFCVPETKGKTEKEIEKYFW